MTPTENFPAWSTLHYALKLSAKIETQMVSNSVAVSHPLSRPSLSKGNAEIVYLSKLTWSPPASRSELSASVSRCLSARLDFCQRMLSELSYAEIEKMKWRQFISNFAALASSLSLIGGWHPEGSPAGWDYCLAQENPGGHVHAPVPSRPTGEYGLPAAGVLGPEGRHGHHDSPPQPGPVWGWREQSQHPGGCSQQSGQPVPHGPCLAPLALRRQRRSEEDQGLRGRVQSVCHRSSEDSSVFLQKNTLIFIFSRWGLCVTRFSFSCVSANTCSCFYYNYYYGLFTPFFVLKRFCSL